MMDAAGKYEVGILASLDVGSEQHLDVLLRVFSDLLEFVDSDHTPFIRTFQIVENLFERYLRLTDLAQTDIEFRSTGKFIEFKRR